MKTAGKPSIPESVRQEIFDFWQFKRDENGDIYTLKAIAEKFGIAKVTVGNIITQKLIKL